MARPKKIVPDTAPPVEEVAEVAPSDDYVFADSAPVVEDVAAPTVENAVLCEEPKAEDIVKIDDSDIERRIKIDTITAIINKKISATQPEIERCNDYIFACADSDRRFTTYRNELYEYRYKLRQLIFDPNYPDFEKVKFPPLPEWIPDQ